MYWDASHANLEQADAYSQKALEVGPDAAEAHASRGLALTLSQRYAEAEEEFATAIRLNPQQFEAHYFYGRAVFQQGKNEEAIAHFLEASRVRPEDYQTLFLASSPLRQLGRREEEQEVLQRALDVAERHLELNPDDARALYMGAGALAQQGDREGAMDWARRALAVDPEDPGVLYNVACAYAQAGETGTAVTLIEQAVHNGFGHKEWLEHDSDLNSLRDDPRFQAVLKQM